MPDMEDLGLTEEDDNLVVISLIVLTEAADDDEVAVDWDEMADWPLDGEEEEDEDE